MTHTRHSESTRLHTMDFSAPPKSEGAQWTQLSTCQLEKAQGGMFGWLDAFKAKLNYGYTGAQSCYLNGFRPRR